MVRFVVDLPNPRADDGRNQLINLLATLAGSPGWIDVATRAVFVDMLLFNANENLFMLATTVRLHAVPESSLTSRRPAQLVEFPRVGGAVVSWDFLITKVPSSARRLVPHSPLLRYAALGAA